MTGQQGYIHQISVSPGGVPKLAVAADEVTADGLSQNSVAHPGVHGGPERALCLYSLELIHALQAEGHPIFPGSAGENVTIGGLRWDALAPGVRLRLGHSVLVEITRYTTPCKTIAASFKDGDGTRILHTAHPGWSRVYAKVLQGGRIAAGDPVSLVAPSQT